MGGISDKPSLELELDTACNPHSESETDHWKDSPPPPNTGVALEEQIQKNQM